MSLVRHRGPVVVVPSTWPALAPTVRYAGPAVAAMFAALKKPDAASMSSNVRHRIDVHIVPLKRRRR